jgi:hypothetical protein
MPHDTLAKSAMTGHRTPMSRFLRFLCALGCAVLVSGCYDNHLGDTSPDGHAIELDSSTTPPEDAGTSTTPDTGWTDVVVESDAALTPRRDAGLHPSSDGGPPGDRAGDLWEGYIEALAFSSGSDHVRIQLDSASGSGPATGYVTFGADVALPAPASDPNVGWPTPATYGFGQLIEGYPYRFVDGTVSADRVQITIDLGSPWASWCEMQFPVPLTPGATQYGCLPNTSGLSGDVCGYLEPETNIWIEVDCGRARLCGIGGACLCDASTCTARRSPGMPIDFHVVGNTGTGTIAAHNAYLTR